MNTAKLLVQWPWLRKWTELPKSINIFPEGKVHEGGAYIINNINESVLPSGGKVFRGAHDDANAYDTGYVVYGEEKVSD